MISRLLRQPQCRRPLAVISRAERIATISLATAIVIAVVFVATCRYYYYYRLLFFRFAHGAYHDTRIIVIIILEYV